MKIKSLCAAVALASSATVFAGDDTLKGSKSSDFQELNSFFSFLNIFQISASPVDQQKFGDFDDDDDDWLRELPVSTELAGDGLYWSWWTNTLKSNSKLESNNNRPDLGWGLNNPTA